MENEIIKLRNIPCSRRAQNASWIGMFTSNTTTLQGQTNNSKANNVSNCEKIRGHIILPEQQSARLLSFTLPLGRIRSQSVFCRKKSEIASRPVRRITCPSFIIPIASTGSSAAILFKIQECLRVPMWLRHRVDFRVARHYRAPLAVQFKDLLQLLAWIMYARRKLECYSPQLAFNLRVVYFDALMH